MNDTLIISDIHLGSDISRVKLLIPKLQSKLEDGSLERIILLGDIFQDINFKRLAKHHWKFLSLLRKYSDLVEIVWVIGNHDYQISDVMSHLVGFPTYEKYVWKQNYKTYCAIHGHQFDKTLGRFSKIKDFFVEIYLEAQKIKFLNSFISKCVQYSENKLSTLQIDVRNGAIELAKENYYDYIFCGHTHIAEHHTVDKINYYNSGCWVNNIGTILIVDDTGATSIYSFNTEQLKNSNSNE